MTTPHVLFDYVGHLPECPTWSEDESALYWADILEQEIHRYHPASGAHSVLAFPEEVGCFALREQGDLLWPCVMLSGWPIKMDYCSVRFATIPLIRNWRVSTMAAPMAMGVFMPGRSGRRVTIMAHC